MLRNRPPIAWLVLLFAAFTGCDVLSTVGGIASAGWAGFGESNLFVRALWPHFGIAAPLVYWPLEILLNLSLGVGFCYAWYWPLKRLNYRFDRWQERGHILIYSALWAPAAATVINTLFALGILRPF